MGIDVRVSVVADPSGPRFQPWLADGYIVKTAGQANIQGSGTDVNAIHLDVRTSWGRADACVYVAVRFPDVLVI